MRWSDFIGSLRTFDGNETWPNSKRIVKIFIFVTQHKRILNETHQKNTSIF